MPWTICWAVRKEKETVSPKTWCYWVWRLTWKANRTRSNRRRIVIANNRIAWSRCELIEMDSLFSVSFSRFCCRSFIHFLCHFLHCVGGVLLDIFEAMAVDAGWESTKMDARRVENRKQSRAGRATIAQELRARITCLVQSAKFVEHRRLYKRDWRLPGG